MDIVSKLWGFCHKLRHDGVDSSDYIEQLTYLLFLKMADEKGIAVPEGYDWQSLLSKNNGELVLHLEKIFYNLGKEKGLLKLFFREPFSRIKQTTVLGEIIKEIDTTTWEHFDKNALSFAFKKAIGEDFKKEEKKRVEKFIERFDILKKIPTPNEKTLKLEDIIQIISEKLPKKIEKEEILEEGKYPIISQSHRKIVGYTNDESRLFSNNLPVIVFGDHTRVVKYIDYPFAIYGYGVRIIVPLSDIIIPKYLFYAIQNVNIPDLGYSRHFSEVRKLHIFVPSLEKQKEIVEILDKQYSELEKKESIIELEKKEIQRRKNSLFQEILNKSQEKV